MLRIFSVTVLTLLAAPALAQTPQMTSPANPTVPIAPPNAPSPPPEKLAPATGSAATGTPANDSMSGRLAQQKGTITPRNVDPGMTVAPPATGTTPVIPPPGSSGGNPSVVPK